ncbi:electron transfer flavoprotein subunit beta/FixA family protein [Mucilaginibacter ginsenosidivorans]|uniref:Electron transfer flavoprotein subunit beta/FixA family protein n=1 Tax=Mucilaginibacter ginsenosidivorans TaxID=398053 RepID=A0A5B8UZI5_9SPHI|nr:electron transfer flavoprotein subunit beta/FixA family protein [Mucilaginibacter ginsenosidivorans]QEC64175.1 electron transfer flavoprotein subunit beta/FixA family protein [Mucilaginibacter ginsenosidivorans]
MKILVCISNVPDTTTKITFTDNNTQFNTNGVQFILNPYDEIALSRAIELTEGGKGTITVINVGEVATEATIRKALAIGADDAVRINAKPHDAWFVSYQIADYVKQNAFDLILAGRESIDYNGSKVAGMLGELLDIPSVSIIKKLDIDGDKGIVEREIEGGKEILVIPFPFVAGAAEGVAEPKIPNMRGIMSARTKPLNVIEPVEVKVTSEILNYETPAPRGQVKLIAVDDSASLIGLLHTEARVI